MTPLALRKDPGALYAAALGALHLSPQVQAVLSPAGAQLFSAAYGAALEVGGSAIGSIGALALEEAVAIVGPEVVSEVASVAGAVAGAVGDAIPFVNVFVGIVQILLNPAFAAKGSNYDEQDCISFWSQQPGSSGPSDPMTGNTYTTPADIFASSTGNINPLRIPNSALGNCLAAITECGGGRADGNDGSEDDAVSPSGSLHTCYGNSMLPHLFNNLWGGKYPNVGIPEAHRSVYRALRFAIASNGPDHGAIPYGLYMDLLAGDYDAGRLPLTYIAFLLNCYVRKRYVGPAFIPVLSYSVCGGPPAQSMAGQIAALIEAWKRTRAKLQFHKVKTVPKFRINLAAKPVYYGVRAWSPASGWTSGQWVERLALAETITGAVASYFAVYDSAGRLVVQGYQNEVLAKVAGIVYNKQSNEKGKR